ncbi:type IV pilin protein [Variovorax sp. V118]|uniref:type IV pilin protein n=1 Tax=Variovorax sp. V118 TaxID=3065954 RepID=UPI0034E8B3D0
MNNCVLPPPAPVSLKVESVRRTGLQSFALKQAAGFTLIELMITVAIVAILAAIGYPAYGDYVRRGQLVEGFTQLSDYRGKMEQYFQDNRNYGTDNTCATAASWKTFVPADAKNFSYACQLTDSGLGYVITATGSSRATGHQYTINHNGVRGTIKFKGTTVSVSCWLVKGTTC